MQIFYSFRMMFLLTMSSSDQLKEWKYCVLLVNNFLYENTYILWITERSSHWIGLHKLFHFDLTCMGHLPKTASRINSPPSIRSLRLVYEKKGILFHNYLIFWLFFLRFFKIILIIIIVYKMCLVHIFFIKRIVHKSFLHIFKNFAIKKFIFVNCCKLCNIY